MTVWLRTVSPMMRNRQEIGRSRDSVGAFRSRHSTLGRTGPVVYAPASRLDAGRSPIGSSFDGSAPAVPSAGVPSGMPRSADEAERRRRDIIRVLAAAAVLSLIVALLMPSAVAWLLHLTIDVLLGGYVALVARLRSVTMERDQKVHYLRPAVVEAPRQQPALKHRSGS